MSEQFHMNAEALEVLRSVVALIGKADDALEPEGLYLSGPMEVRHGDGFRVGIIERADWDEIVFRPDYQEDDDE